jgi:anti-anti-sigma factor
MKENTDIKLQQQGDITIMNIRGDITSYSESIFKEAYQQAIAQGAHKIIFKIEKFAYINSGGIALIIQTLYQIKENKQIAAIAGVSPHFKKIFNMVGLAKFAGIFDSLSEALDDLKGRNADAATH